jgi:single-strand DNA-binding protein
MLKAQVIGNLGSDPEMKYSRDGSPLLQMNVASNYRVRDQAGEWSDRTEWIRVTVFGKRAESLAPMLHKGMRVYADGRLEARPWTSQGGEVRAGLEMVASDVEFVSSRQDGGQQPAPRASVADERRRPAGADDDSDLESLPF